MAPARLRAADSLAGVTDETYEPAVGDEVLHKSLSGLPHMVVIDNRDRNAIECRWVDSTKRVQTARFPADELKRRPPAVLI